MPSQSRRGLGQGHWFIAVAGSRDRPAELLALLLLEHFMTDSSGRTNAVRERAHPRLIVGLILAAVLIVGIGAFAVWRNSELASTNKVTQISTPAATASDDPSQIAASSAALSTVKELRETIAALQSTQKQ